MIRILIEDDQHIKDIREYFISCSWGVVTYDQVEQLSKLTDISNIFNKKNRYWIISNNKLFFWDCKKNKYFQFSGGRDEIKPAHTIIHYQTDEKIPEINAGDTFYIGELKFLALNSEEFVLMRDLGDLTLKEVKQAMDDLYNKHINPENETTGEENDSNENKTNNNQNKGGLTINDKNKIQMRILTTDEFNECKNEIMNHLAKGIEGKEWWLSTPAETIGKKEQKNVMYVDGNGNLVDFKDAKGKKMLRTSNLRMGKNVFPVLDLEYAADLDTVKIGESLNIGGWNFVIISPTLAMCDRSAGVSAFVGLDNFKKKATKECNYIEEYDGSLIQLKLERWWKKLINYLKLT